MISVLNWTAAILTIITTTGLLLSKDWRWSLGYLALQYVGVFWMVKSNWLISMAAAKLVTGWMVCVILGITHIHSPVSFESETSWPQGNLFRAITAAFALAVTFALASRTAAWLGLELPIAWSGLILLGIGLLMLGMTSQPFRVILGILTFLAGFEVLYAGVETSILVAALLAAVNLGVALTGAYFLVTRNAEAPQ